MKNLALAILACSLLPGLAPAAKASPCGVNCIPYENPGFGPKIADEMRGHLIDGSRSTISGPSGRDSSPHQYNPRSRSAK